jgi:transcriptional regulator with XRE-family HTH domain
MTQTQKFTPNWARNLTRARKAKGLSVKRLAELVGVSDRQGWRWEAGESVPAPENADKLAEILGVPVWEITPASPPEDVYEDLEARLAALEDAVFGRRRVQGARGVR